MREGAGARGSREMCGGLARGSRGSPDVRVHRTSAGAPDVRARMREGAGGRDVRARMRRPGAFETGKMNSGRSRRPTAAKRKEAA